MSKILGIDYGSRRIGLAIGEETLKIALPFDIILNKVGWVGQLRRVIDGEKVYRLVVGRPLNMSGEETQKTSEVEEFISELELNFHLPIIRQDERLSSKLADQLYREYKRKYPRDAVAAMVILQSYLDSIR